jgi:hypothetical protein
MKLSDISHSRKKNTLAEDVKRVSQLLLEADDWHLSHTILDYALDDLAQSVKVDHTYDIPYVAGYNISGGTIYIDKDMPLSLVIGGDNVDVTKYLMLHEIVEKSILKSTKVSYQDAHQIALRTERDAVINDGISWDEYNSKMEKYISAIGNKENNNLPLDLDLKPYTDERDVVELRKMEPDTDIFGKKTPTAKQLSNKYNISIFDVYGKIQQGITVEVEHTSDKEIASEIARDHLGEDIDYYDKLANMEKTFTGE